MSYKICLLQRVGEDRAFTTSGQFQIEFLNQYHNALDLTIEVYL